MSEKFPYGYDVNAYIDKAFEQMKADFPWATREMIAENTNLGIEKMEGEYQYVRKWKANISTSPITPGMMER